MRAYIFIARRVQPSLSLVDHEAEVCILTKLFSYYRFLPPDTKLRKNPLPPRFEPVTWVARRLRGYQLDHRGDRLTSNDLEKKLRRSRAVSCQGDQRLHANQIKQNTPNLQARRETKLSHPPHCLPGNLLLTRPSLHIGQRTSDKNRTHAGFSRCEACCQTCSPGPLRGRRNGGRVEKRART